MLSATRAKVCCFSICAPRRPPPLCRACAPAPLPCGRPSRAPLTPLALQGRTPNGPAAAPPGPQRLAGATPTAACICWTRALVRHHALHARMPWWRMAMRGLMPQWHMAGTRILPRLQAGQQCAARLPLWPATSGMSPGRWHAMQMPLVTVPCIAHRIPATLHERCHTRTTRPNRGQTAPTAPPPHAWCPFLPPACAPLRTWRSSSHSCISRSNSACCRSHSCCSLRACSPTQGVVSRPQVAAQP